MSQSKINIFAGTGGVGKTTLATSKAFYEASLGKNVLLITIDPSLRLKQLLNLEDSSGKTSQVCLKNITQNPKDLITLDALCFNPLDTLKKITIGESTFENMHNNRILQILTQPFGGMNEIMAYLELSYQFFNNQYDLIVLDTPPGKNFLDFIKVFENINTFFNYYFFEIFKFLPALKKGKKSNLFEKVISSGIDKLLHYLEKVTGPNFVEEFIKTVSVLYEKKELFLKAATLKDYLNDKSVCSIYFTSSSDQVKIHELNELLTDINNVVSANNFLVINKTLTKHLSDWKPETPIQIQLKSNLLSTEANLAAMAAEHKLKTLLFSENLSKLSSDHLTSLFQEWNSYGNSKH